MSTYHVPFRMAEMADFPGRPIGRGDRIDGGYVSDIARADDDITDRWLAVEFPPVEGSRRIGTGDPGIREFYDSVRATHEAEYGTTTLSGEVARRAAADVGRMVNGMMAYDRQEIVRHRKSFTDPPGDFNLGDPTLQGFVWRQRGYCVPMAALTGLALERLHRDGLLSGTGSLNFSARYVDGEFDAGHAWAEYMERTDDGFDRYVVDPAHGVAADPAADTDWHYLPEMTIEPELLADDGVLDSTRSAIGRIYELF